MPTAKKRNYARHARPDLAASKSNAPTSRPSHLFLHKQVLSPSAQIQIEQSTPATHAMLQANNFSMSEAVTSAQARFKPLKRKRGIKQSGLNMEVLHSVQAFAGTSPQHLLDFDQSCLSSVHAPLLRSAAALADPCAPSRGDWNPS